MAFLTSLSLSIIHNISSETSSHPFIYTQPFESKWGGSSAISSHSSPSGRKGPPGVAPVALRHLGSAGSAVGEAQILVLGELSHSSDPPSRRRLLGSSGGSRGGVCLLSAVLWASATLRLLCFILLRWWVMVSDELEQDCGYSRADILAVRLGGGGTGLGEGSRGLGGGRGRRPWWWRRAL